MYNRTNIIINSNFFGKYGIESNKMVTYVLNIATLISIQFKIQILNIDENEKK